MRRALIARLLAAAVLIVTVAPARSDLAPPPPAPEVEPEYYVMDAATFSAVQALLVRASTKLEAQAEEIERLHARLERGGCT